MRHVWVHPEPPSHELAVRHITGLLRRCGWEEAAEMVRKLEDSRNHADARYRDLQRVYAEMLDRYEPRTEPVQPLYHDVSGKPGERSDG